MQRYASIDFECYYDADYSIKTIGTWNYVYNPKFDCYLVAVYSDKGEWVGHPGSFDWQQLDGHILIAHNVGFDGLVFRRLQELGTIPRDLNIPGWKDTADMVAYLRVPRNLRDASKQLLDITVSKGTRDRMKGKTYVDAIASGMGKELHEYGGMDAKLAYMLWNKFNHLWPESEQQLSQESREACWRGVHVDRDMVEHALYGKGRGNFTDLRHPFSDDFTGLELQLFDAKRDIPWSSDSPPLSPTAIREEGRKCGIPVPSSLDQDNPDAQKWLEEYGPKYPWVRAIGTYRKINTLVKKLQNLKAGIRDDGTFPYQVKYFGSHTGRFSAGGDRADNEGGKFNILNQAKFPRYGLDERGLITAPPGHVFLLFDYAQVEARAVLWRSGDVRFLDMIRAEHNLYQAYAKMRGIYAGSQLKKDNFDLYNHCKAEVLSCGYQCGWERYKDMALNMYGLVLTDEEAQVGVTTYRETFPLVPEHWRWHQNQLFYSINHHDPTHEVELASGRRIVYFNPKFRTALTGRRAGKLEAVAEYIKGTPPKKLYGGLITENEIQATCRDVLRDAWLACTRAGFRNISFSVYDELVFPFPADNPADIQAATKEIAYLMCNSSPWAKGLPLDVEINISRRYMK